MSYRLFGVRLLLAGVGQVKDAEMELVAVGLPNATPPKPSE